MTSDKITCPECGNKVKRRGLYGHVSKSHPDTSYQKVKEKLENQNPPSEGGGSGEDTGDESTDSEDAEKYRFPYEEGQGLFVRFNPPPSANYILKYFKDNYDIDPRDFTSKAIIEAGWRRGIRPVLLLASDEKSKQIVDIGDKNMAKENDPLADLGKELLRQRIQGNDGGRMNMAEAFILSQMVQQKNNNGAEMLLPMMLMGNRNMDEDKLERLMQRFEKNNKQQSMDPTMMLLLMRGLGNQQNQGSDTETILRLVSEMSKNNSNDSMKEMLQAIMSKDKEVEKKDKELMQQDFNNRFEGLMGKLSELEKKQNEGKSIKEQLEELKESAKGLKSLGQDLGFLNNASEDTDNKKMEAIGNILNTALNSDTARALTSRLGGGQLSPQEQQRVDQITGQPGPQPQAPEPSEIESVETW